LTAVPTKLQRLLGLPSLVARHHELLRNFMRREFEAEFHGTLLGRLWPVLQPVALIAIYNIIFVWVIGIRFSGSGVGHGMEAFYIAAGVLPWIAFQDALHRSCGIIVDHGNLIKKVAFPSEILPLQVVLVQLSKEIIGLAVLVIVLVVAKGVWPTGWIVWLPLVLVFQILFTLGIAFLVAALQVFIRDTAPTLGLVTVIWMFATPIFYPLSLAAQNEFPFLWWFDWNPMAQLVALYRQILGIATEGTLSHLFAFGAWGMVSFVLGFLFFARSRDRFADEV